MLKFNEDFIKNYDEESDKGYIFEVDVEYPTALHKLHSDLPFFSERMKTNERSKLVCNLYDGYQEAWLKEYNDMNTELRKKAKNDFEKYLFKLMDNSVFGKTMENIKKHRDIKLVTTDKRRNQLVSEPNHHAIKGFSENLVATEMKKTIVEMNKPVYLGLSILEISKTLMYEVWYDYIKPKYQHNAELCYMDTDSFFIYIKTEDF